MYLLEILVQVENIENMDNSRELLNTISFFLKENGYNEKALVYLLIKILCKYPYDNRTNDMIKRMEQLPGIEHIFHDYYPYFLINILIFYRVHHLKEYCNQLDLS